MQDENHIKKDQLCLKTTDIGISECPFWWSKSSLDI